MKKIMVAMGTRPEAIKMCPLIKALEKEPKFNVVTCVTGQHKEMLYQVLDIFNVKPAYDLEIMKPGQTLFDITSEILTKFKDVLEKEKPDIVLVHGDTTTAFACGLAGFYANTSVGHVEAGLRTFNLKAPFPEEFNRQAVDIFADYYFAPTKAAAKNLIKEGKEKSKIFVTGNTVIDAMKYTVTESYENDHLTWAKDSRLILLTAHRRENLGEPMKNMFKAIRRIVDELSDVKVIYPVHLNPVVRKTADEVLGNHERIRLIEPLEVKAFHNFMANSYIILTDSGGIQEEAPSLGKPVLVMRDTTERPEGIKAGTLKLVGTNEDVIYKNFYKLLIDKKAYSKMSEASNPYGDGLASERIIEILKKN